jgi:RNA recognition motif-containing protein
MVKLFVGGFPLDINEMDLAKLIAPHGTISTIKMIRDRATKKLKGYAFVEMATQTDAEQVIEALHNAELKDRVLTVKIVEETEQTSAPARRPFQGGRPGQQRSSSSYGRPDSNYGRSDSSYGRSDSNYDPNKKKRPRRSL